METIPITEAKARIAELADLRQSRDDFAAGDTFDAAQVRAELDQRRRRTQ